MTKGAMQCDDNPSDARASDVARRIAFDDLTMRYHTSLQMARRLKRPATYPPYTNEATEMWAKAMAAAQRRHGSDESIAMETDVRLSPTGDDVFFPYDRPQVPPLIKIPKQSYVAKQRLMTWPYYMRSYPMYFSPIRMVRPEYSSTSPSSSPHISHTQSPPCGSYQPKYERPDEVTESNDWRDAPLIVSCQGKEAFSAKNIDMDEVKISKTETMEAPETGNEVDLKKDKIMIMNSTRPSVLVMQRSSPSTSSNSERTSSCYDRDDHDTTDSDYSVSPSSSPPAQDLDFVPDSSHVSDSYVEKPHKCRICQRAFRKHSALIIHHRVHSGEKPYKCPECSKHFSISGNLRRHLLIHTGERPYVCAECSRAFNNPSHLTRHRRKLHGTRNAAEQK